MSEPKTHPRSQRALILASWLFVGTPLAYGVSQLVVKVTKLFAGV